LGPAALVASKQRQAVEGLQFFELNIEAES
jgi:hypothetical protein